MSAATPPTRNWLELIVQVGAADIDDVAALIVSEVPAAAAGTEQRGDEVVFWVEADASAAALIATRDAVARWQAAGLAVDPAKVRLATALPESEWRDAWKRYFKVTHVTRRIVIVPSWETYAPAPGEVIIDLDPGMAFGTGTHASTRLVLDELQQLADDELGATRVLDVGCGSGILAIAAVKLWPSATCIAVDNDPIAVAATLENAAHNRVADRIEASTATLDAIGEEFPLVLANIQAHVLRELRSQLIACTAPGGRLILSGLLTPQAEPLAAEFVAAGMRKLAVRASADDPQWSAVTLVR